MTTNTSILSTCIRGSIFLLLLLLTACSTTPSSRYAMRQDGPPGQWVDVSKIPNAVPKVEPLSRYGNPPFYIVDGYRYNVLKSAQGYNQVGYASWYGMKFHGALTSTREPYNIYSMTAASTILPLPTFVQVTNLANGRSVIVKVNDRGPFRSNRIIDLSYAAAVKLGYANKGTALVRVTAIDPSTWNRQPSPTPSQVANNSNPMQVAPSTTSQIYLQVGAFSNQATAANLGQRISVLTNTPVTIQSAYVNNNLIYRVHIGPVTTSKYEEIRQQLIQQGLGVPIPVNS